MLLLRMHGTRYVVPEGRYQSHFFCLRVSLTSNVYVIAYFSMVNPAMDSSKLLPATWGKLGVLPSNLISCLIALFSSVPIFEIH